MTSREPFARLGTRWPIFQAPIGTIASAELAAAVSEAGGVGHLACTWRTPEKLAELFRRMTHLTKKPYGANFVLDFPIEDRLSVALSHGVPIISFFWGDGSRYLTDVHAGGALAVQVVGSVDEAKRAADTGFDLVVAQGREAGGHVRGNLGTIALVPQVVDAIDPLPVIAAGGISDSRGVAAALALGAAGVWVGTRFLTAVEADIHPEYRELVLRASGDDTLYSSLFNVGWNHAPLRTLKNSTVLQWERAGRPQPPNRPEEGAMIATREDGSGIPRYHFASPTRDVKGQVEAMALYAGECVGLVRSTEPAARIVRELAKGLMGERPSAVMC